MSEARATSMADRWRREATRGVDEKRLQMALQTLPSIRQPMVRIVVGAITAEFEGAMGSIHEVSVRVPPLPAKIWEHVARVLRRSAKMLEALKEGRVPLAFDRLVARVGGESALPEGRRISHACTCGLPESPCRHVLALHELFARRLEDKAWLLLQLRGVNIRELIEKATTTEPRTDGPTLAFGADEEPVLFPEGGDGDLDTTLTREQVASLIGLAAPGTYAAVEATLAALEQPPVVEAAVDPAAGAKRGRRRG